MATRSSSEDLINKIKELEKNLVDCRQTISQLQVSEEKYKKRYSKTKKSEMIYRSIIYSSADAIAIFDLNGMVKYVSPSFTEVFGWTKEEVEGKRIPFLPEAEKEKTTAFIVELTLDGTPCQGLETKRYRKDGGLVNVSLSASRFYNPDGNPEGMFVILHDISERKKLQNQLLQAHKMQALGTLAGGIAHDFNNIIFNIIGYTEMIKADVGEDSLSGQNLEEVLRAAYRARDLVRHIRTFSGQPAQDRKPMQIQPVVQETMQLLRTSLPSNIKIRQQLNEACGPVMADPSQVHQVIMNLGSNAIHAMHEKGGTLTVEITESVIDEENSYTPPGLGSGSYIKISVSDTGHGMDRTIKDRIFDPFFTTKEPGDGTGMGLSVVHGIVKDYGGHIEVLSEPGGGTTFTIYLPRIDKQNQPTKRSVQPHLNGGGEYILVVDDEEHNVYMLRQILERLGYHTTGRMSGLDALETFRGEPDQFDLIITDMTMPNMNGTQLAEKLLEIRPDIPIILCAGFSETIPEEKASALGIRQTVMKPTVTNELAAAIRRVLDMESGGSSRFTILVVDDDETLRMMLRQHLEDAVYNVSDATNGREALKILATEPVNLVLTDVRMPDMDGFELMANMSADYSSIPVMVMSAYGTPETTKRFKEMGSMQVMDKPVDLDDLTRRITESLHQVSQGGTMTGISVSSFLQLIEMEQKSCILEVRGQNRQKGFLYFSQGVLCDAVCDQLRGEEATLKIISWENVLLSFNALPQKKIQRKIKMDLMSLLLEGLKLKDETRA